MLLHICWCDHHLTPAAIDVHSCMQDLDVVSSATAFLSTVQVTTMRLLQTALMADGSSPQLPLHCCQYTTQQQLTPMSTDFTDLVTGRGIEG